MSVSDLEQTQLQLIQQLNSNGKFGFSERLQTAFDHNGTRDPVDPVWLKTFQPTTSLMSKGIRPIMSKEEVDIMTETSLKRHEDEEEEDLNPLVESIRLLSTSSSSQVQIQQRMTVLTSVVTLSTPQLKKVIDSVDFSCWSEDTVSDCFQELTTETIPKANLVLIIYAIFYEKIASLSSSAPRLLMNTVIVAAKKEGKAILNGLLIPLLFQSKLERPQNEVTIKTITESLNASQRYSFLQTILTDGENYFNGNQTILSDQSRKYLKPWNESVVQIVHTILSAQPLLNLTKSDFEELIRSVEMLVHTNPKDKGSMQLLLLMTSKYSQLLVEFKMIATVEKICHTSNMFLKRAVLGQINSLKKKKL
ncbi:hypothetical protein A0J61_07271 [Choanephora cucurbitarum]|uniref:Fanconi Anaemia group E protein C-terminal domain-containing protein n=1 Tax=Choanephora cucurbitarum TaxID=101091 RepID=A0A1C7N7T1_9FUNG|nr:hypothetical protein A0J61_07271 [Choanephora cucurbitarum]